MKNQYFMKNGLAIGLVSFLMVTSCQYFDFELPRKEKENGNKAVIFPETASLFGKNNEDWAIKLGKASVALDCEKVLQAQLLDLTSQVVAPYGNVEDGAAEYTITRDKHVFLSPAFYFINYPCPGEGWEPAEDQSLEEFLRENAKEVINTIESLEVHFDGIEVGEVDDYRLNTDLFHFTGNPVLAGCYDDCITGEPQPGLIDGYFMMFKKMKVGTHTIFIKGELPDEATFEISIVFNVVN